MINHDDLDLAIDHCRREDLVPYNQTTWGSLNKKTSCATGACLAGTYVLMKGYHFVAWRTPPDGIYYCADDEGSPRPIVNVAQDGLGLTDDQAGELFFYRNDLDVIEHMAKHLRDHPDADGDDLYEIRAQVARDRAAGL
jgi:hypothetical protein